jgi:hypothetical protein
LSKSPLERKKAYVQSLASVEGINTSMMNWSSLLELTNLQIGMDVVLRALLDTFAMLDLHFDFTEFDWHQLDFTQEFSPEFVKTPKARYDMTKYNYCYYDPEQAGAKNLERLIWKWRKKAIERHELTYHSAHENLKKYIEIAKDALIKKEVKEEYLDAMEEKLALIEGKFFSIPYVGFTVVGLHKIPKIDEKGLEYNIRDPKDWKTDRRLETIALYENHVGYCRVGYSRVTSKRVEVKKSLADHIKNTIEDFRKRVGKVVIEGVTTTPYPYPYAYPPTYAPYKAELLFPRVFFLQRVDQMHYEGGSHQIKIQDVINRAKQILDEEGIIGVDRLNYLAFAQELYYLGYQPHKLWKRYRNMLTEEDLINKYINMKCQKNILDRIKGVVKP